jgi:hypothetical protein
MVCVPTQPSYTVSQSVDGTHDTYESTLESISTRAGAVTERILRKKVEQTARSVLPNKTRANNW